MCCLNYCVKYVTEIFNLLFLFVRAGDAVVPRKAKTHGLKIFQRFHFSSSLKRMSVIAGHTSAGSNDIDYVVTVKGAPETLRSMVCLLIASVLFSV